MGERLLLLPQLQEGGSQIAVGPREAGLKAHGLAQEG
jgi:hypothetical protein